MSREQTHSHSGETGKLRRLGERVIDEFRQFVILFIYLWVLFGLFVLNGAIVTRQQGLAFVFHGFAIVNALVLGKVMLVAEGLELARWLRGKPLAWTILFESVLCTALLMAFHVIEHVAIGLYRGERAADSVPEFGGGGFLGFVIVALIIFISLLPFFAFKNVARAIGAERMRELLFQSPRTTT